MHINHLIKISQLSPTSFGKKFDNKIWGTLPLERSTFKTVLNKFAKIINALKFKNSTILNSPAI